MGKGEISWKRTGPDGERLQVYAHHTSGRWDFFIRHRRYDQWQRLESPPLEDWLNLLDGVRRRIARRLLRPEEEARVQKSIKERYPEADL